MMRFENLKRELSRSKNVERMDEGGQRVEAERAAFARVWVP